MASDEQTASAATRFMRTLQQMEQTRDPEPLCRLFASDAELASMPKLTRQKGQGGARAFWDDYLSVFREIRSTFTRAIEQGNMVALEWRAKGSLQSGDEVAYEGVTVLELGDEGLVERFRTYYDPTPFIPAPGTHASAGV